MTTHASRNAMHGYLEHSLISKTTNILIIGQLIHMAL